MDKQQADPLGLVGTVIERRFQVESIAGKGGFGVVYRATQLRLARAVALKVLIPRTDVTEDLWQQMAAAFLQEAELVAKVQHPNVVQILDHGMVTLADSRVAPWMALEWLEGPTLSTELQLYEGVQRTPSEVIGRVRPLLQALAALHSQGIAHRDVKPSNIMIVRTPDGTELLKLLDLGIAKETSNEDIPGSGQTLTQGSSSGLSPRYAAPEQFVRGRTGPWTDVYAASLIIIEMLVGQRAYGGKDFAEFAAAAMNPIRPTPATFGVDATPWEQVLAVAVATRPADRPPNAAALLHALESALVETSASSRSDLAPPHHETTTRKVVKSDREGPHSRSARRSRPAPQWIAVMVMVLGIAVVTVVLAKVLHLQSRPKEVEAQAPLRTPEVAQANPVAAPLLGAPTSAISEPSAQVSAHTDSQDTRVARHPPADPNPRWPRSHHGTRTPNVRPPTEQSSPRQNPVGFPEP